MKQCGSTEGVHHAHPTRPPGTEVQKTLVELEAASATHRLQLVHEPDQELAALRSLAVQLHAGLHGVEATCGMERTSHQHLRSRKTPKTQTLLQ